MSRRVTSGAGAALNALLSREDCLRLKEALPIRSETKAQQGKDPDEALPSERQVDAAELRRRWEELSCAHEQTLAALAAERLAREQAERANRAKDGVLATISHELRTPLNAVLGWTQLLKSERLEPAQRTRAIDTIERNAVAQIKLVSDLLEVSRMITGKLSVVREPVDLAEIVTKAMDGVRLEAKKKSTRLSMCAESVTVLGDVERLHQVMCNLLSNALKFGRPGGTIAVRLTKHEGLARIDVCDDGRGIRPEFLPHVFEAFQQENESSNRLHQGMGLGLAITERLVTLHEGRIAVFSEGEGRGAKFTVDLPAIGGAEPAVGSAAAATRRRRALAGTRVLVVDDEPDTIELLRVVLEQSGAIVTTATSARDALAIFEAARPGVIVSDIRMQGEDGYLLLRAIREEERLVGGHVPAIALTAYARPRDRERALAAGFQMHIPKPIRANVLLDAIETLLDKRAADVD